MAAGPGGGAGAYSGWAVPPAVEPDRTVALGGTARTTACRWSRRAVVTWQLVIGPFELKFNRLNTNSTV
jgi:hypothetical protein